MHLNMLPLLAAVMCLAVSLMPAAAEGQLLSIELEGRYWLPDATAKVKSSAAGVAGSRIDFEEDLGVDNENVLDGEIAVRFLNRHRVRFSFLSMELDGEQRLSRTISFSGQTFDMGTSVRSSLDITMYRLGYEFDILKGRLGFLGPFIEARLFELEARLAAPALGIDQREDITLPLPALGLAGRLDLPIPPPFPGLSLTAEVAGLSLGDHGHFVDANAALRLTLVQLPLFSFEVAGGYRILSFEAKAQGNRGELTLSGPFVLAAVRF